MAAEADVDIQRQAAVEVYLEQRAVEEARGATIEQFATTEAVEWLGSMFVPPVNWPPKPTLVVEWFCPCR
jgi:hypothetical protein